VEVLPEEKQEVRVAGILHQETVIQDQVLQADAVAAVAAALPAGAVQVTGAAVVVLPGMENQVEIPEMEGAAQPPAAVLEIKAVPAAVVADEKAVPLKVKKAAVRQQQEK